MPTYEFRCPRGHEFEKFVRKISDAPAELPCPECGEIAERRVSGGAGLLFKGPGFYLTDYGRDAHRKPAPGAAGADGAGSTGKAEGGEAKGGGEGAKPSEPAKTTKPASDAAAPAGGKGKAAGGGTSKPSGGDA